MIDIHIKMLFLLPIIILLFASSIFVKKGQRFLSFLSLVLIVALSVAWITTSFIPSEATNTDTTALTQPALRRQFIVEPALTNHETERIQEGARWSSKQPVCSKHEFLLTLTNQHESKQINLFYSRGSSEDRLALASGAAKSKIYQCCPHYGVGVKLYYKFYNDNDWFVYPHKVDKQELTLNSTDFELDKNPPRVVGVSAF